MADISSQYIYLNAFQSLTREGFVTRKIIDTVFKAKKFYQYLRTRGMVDDVKGTAALTWPINIGQSPNTTTFDGDDNLPISTMNGNIVRPALGWRRYTDALAIPLTDVFDNNDSPEAIANLLDVQLDITKMSLVDKISSDTVTNTTAINPKGLQGLAEGIDDGTVAPTYAGFSRAQLGAKWKSQVNYSIANGTSANLIANLHTLDLQASVDGSRPDAYFANIAAFGGLIQSLFPQDRYVQPELARTAGGNDLVFNGNPLFLDNAIPTGIATPGTPPGSGNNSGGYMYGINSTYLKLVVNPNVNFITLDWQIGQNNLVIFTRILWFANMVVLKPAAHWAAWLQNY
jgi:hypothetical protein